MLGDVTRYEGLWRDAVGGVAGVDRGKMGEDGGRWGKMGKDEGAG